jgi:cytochrome oxidase Cu insertion factor (SCO1/SenC/PrrC family)
MTAPRRLLTHLAAALALVALVSAQAPAPDAPNPQTIGPNVGARVPDFSLPDQHGRVRTLHSLLGPKGAVLVFFRSADW